MRARGAKLTAQEVEALEAAIRAGKPDWQVARETGISATTVRRRRLAMGIRRSTGGTRDALSPETVQEIERLTDEGKTVTEIAEKLGIFTETVRRYQRKSQDGVNESKKENIPAHLWQEWEDTVNTIRVACGRKPLGDGR